MPSLAVTSPVPSWPVFGNAIPVAFFFMLHIAIAEFSVGAITLAPALELWAHRHGDDAWGMRYARGAANAYYLLFSLGATLAVFAVTTAIGVWGPAMGYLFNRLLPLMGLAFGSFFLLVPMLVRYRNGFGTMRPGAHIALGFATALVQTCFVVLIVGMDAYLITPVHAGFLQDVAANPAYLPLLLHRLAGNVSWTALLLAAYAVLRAARTRDEDERAFQSWAASLNLRIGLLTLLAMPVLGFALIEVLRGSAAGYVANLLSGGAAYLMVVQTALFGVLLIGGNVALRGEDPASTANTLGRVAVLGSAAGAAVAVLPAQVLGPGIVWVRYAALGVAVAVTAVHAVARTVHRPTVPRAVAPGAAAAVPFASSPMARRAVTVVGATALVLSLFMGYLKEEARGQYAVYGVLTQRDAHGLFQPPAGTYP